MLEIFPLVAQLDNAADSDSEERGFESLRAGQTESINRTVGALFFSPIGIRTRRERSGRKQFGELFLPTWATSVCEAIDALRRKNPFERAKKRQGLK